MNTLPDFLQHCRIFFYGPLQNNKDLRKISAYLGATVVTNVEEATHLITDEVWNEKFDKYLEDNPSLLILKSAWLVACKNANKLVATQKYVVPAN